MLNQLALQNLRGQLQQNEPMSKHTTWRVGGMADWFYKPADSQDLMTLMQQLPPELPIFWLGLGSNLLVRDGGLRGLVIATSGLLNEIKLLDNAQLYVEAGVSCAKVARFASQQGLDGIAFLAGIPGTMGGALAMNAGAFGGETWESVTQVKTLNRQGQIHTRLPANYDIGYRHVKGHDNEWFLAATLQLKTQIDENQKAKIKALLQKRNDTQPIGLPSCGSVFRNPPGDYAARLIEQAGWKGYCLGGACVSEKHANFIINQNNATAKEIEALIHRVQADIEARTGITLQYEVKIIGSQ